LVRIRLRREGKKGYPIYKLVATDIRAPRNGGYLEALGQYNPNLNPVTVALKEARLEHWLKKGAQPTDTVRAILRKNGFWLRWTLTRQGKDEATVKNVVERWQLQQTEKPKREADRRTRRAERKKKAAADAASAKTAAAAPAAPAAATPEAPAPAAS
jgi:small subunit ribosomal protein S16